MITEVFSDLVHNQPMEGMRRLVPGWFSWYNTIMFGKAVGATPNGRKAGTPISHGANPNPGFRKDGAATAQAAGIAMVQPGYGNTAPLQLEFDPKMTAEEGGAERVLQLLKTHCRMGGTLININVLDREKLKAANEHPELYPDLVVRVTGFTAYFVSLSPEFRQLVMDRFIEGF
jgi:formate C-acetyltransferase